jgi:hypothetical protein
VNRPPARPRRAEGVRADVLAVLPAWVAARLAVLAALALAHFVAGQPQGGRLRAVGLLGFDAAFYRDIAERGYGPLPAEAQRFFPLVPLLARGLSVPLLGGGGAALLLLANAAALAYAVALVRLARLEGLPADAVARLPWLAALTPPAFVLVMGYTEAVWGLVSVLAFLGLRTRRFGLAAGAGLLLGLCRPVGVLFAVPAAVEARRAGAGGRAGRVLAALAPVVGCGLYLGYLGWRFGDGLRPIREQGRSDLHGPASDPVANVVDAARGTFTGELGTGLHVPWLLGFLALLVVVARRLPASYSWWCAATLAATLTGSNLDSLERYGFGAFPFLLAAALVIRRGWEPLVYVGSAVLLTVYAALAFLGLSVP